MDRVMIGIAWYCLFVKITVNGHLFGNKQFGSRNNKKKFYLHSPLVET